MGALLTQYGMMMASSGGGSSGYTTLNPSDKGSLITLSGGNLVATSTSTSSGIARSVAAITGKKYFEAVLTTAGAAAGATIAAGVANGSHVLTDALGYSNANGWAFWGTNVGARHNSVTAVAGTGAQGDVFGFAVDQTNSKLWIRKNGAWIQGDPAAGTSPIWSNLSGTLYAAACPWTNGHVVTMRFDPASFRDAAPTGFNPIT